MTTVYTPLRVEWAALAGTPGLRLVRFGMGTGRAAAIFRDDEPALVAGVAGATVRQLRAGDLVVADEVRRLGTDEVLPVRSAPLLAGAARRLGLSVHVGPVASAPRIVRDTAMDAGGVLAVDLETATVAECAARAGLPFAVLRAVVDSPGHPLNRPGTPVRGVRALRALRAAAPALRQWADAVGPREVCLAAPRSFCAGVSRAIETVERALDRYGPPVYVRRQIVHNAHVVAQLAARGAVFVEEVDQIPPGAVTVFAAHGVAPSVRLEAAERDLRVIDATCPLVAKVHHEIRRYQGQHRTVFLIGHPDHEEVQGSLGEAPGDVIVVEDAAAARTVRPRDADRVAYTMQTTLAADEADEVAAVLRERFPALEAPRTGDICYATTNRQRAVRAIAAEADLVLVLGSANSSNSARLVEVARRCGATAHLVEDVGDVDLRWLPGADRIGVTAGASAPPHLVSELVTALEGLGPVRTREIRTAAEDVLFTMPKEVS